MERVSLYDVYRWLQMSLRYAMGRRTYVVGEVIEDVERFFTKFSKAERRWIIEEIERELERAASEGRTLGDEGDHQDWKALLERLRKNEMQ